MTKSEHQIQDEIKLALSSSDSFVVRTNAGKFWQGQRVWSNEFKQMILINLKPIQGLPEGFSDLIYIGKNTIAFIETKRADGRTRNAQKLFLNRVQELGHKAGVARSVDDALKIIK